MRILPILFSLLVFAACKQRRSARPTTPVAEDTTFLTGTFYIACHGESYPGEDSSLTPAGHKRAGALYRLLKDSGISKIYTTPYIRSIETADSFRIYRHLDTCIYQADTVGESFIYQLSRREDWGKRIFVVAHRYTILPILHSLRAEIRMTNDDLLGGVKTAKDSIENMLFIVRKTSAGTELKELRIGNVE
jgi:phosphohistidine phosphatase SixA